MRINSCFKLLCMLLLVSCMKFTNRDRMELTSRDVIASIKHDRYADFRSLIGPPLSVLGKDETSVQEDFEDLKRIFKADADKETLAITFPGLYNSLGQRITDIAVDSLHRKLPPDSIYHLKLFFGPPNVYTLNKITGYVLVQGNGVPVGFREEKTHY